MGDAVNKCRGIQVAGIDGGVWTVRAAIGTFVGGVAALIAVLARPRVLANTVGVASFALLVTSFLVIIAFCFFTSGTAVRLIAEPLGVGNELLPLIKLAGMVIYPLLIVIAMGGTVRKVMDGDRPNLLLMSLSLGSYHLVCISEIIVIRELPAMLLVGAAVAPLVVLVAPKIFSWAEQA